MYLGRQYIMPRLLAVFALVVATMQRSVLATYCTGKAYAVIGEKNSLVPLKTGVEICKGSNINVWYKLDQYAKSVKFTSYQNPNINRCEAVMPFAMFGDYPAGDFYFQVASNTGTITVNVLADQSTTNCRSGLTCSFTYKVVDCPDPTPY